MLLSVTFTKRRLKHYSAKSTGAPLNETHRTTRQRGGLPIGKTSMASLGRAFPAYNPMPSTAKGRAAVLGHEKSRHEAGSASLAEGEGFEPSLPGVPVKRFSRPPHSAALPPFRICKDRKTGLKKKAPFRALPVIHWRRDGDSNPRYAFGVYTISNRAP